jgi:hypothetical protein
MAKLRLISLSIVALLFVIVAQQATPALAVPAQQANLLNNPSFEDPYDASGTASGWGRWHQETADPGGCSGPYAFQPKWSREGNPALVRDGSISQHIGNQFDTWHAGVYQNVTVTPGSTYRFTFSAIGRASNDQYPAPSDVAVNLGVRAGIDPNGSGLWTDGDIVWGAAGSPHDGGNQANWQQFSVETTATGSQVTVFVSADLSGANQCRAHLDVWFDGAQLVEAGPPPTATSPPQPTQPPPPPVTNTPVPPTATATTEATPTNTPEPTATPTNTPKPHGIICVNAFADENSNGQNEPAEGAMAGVTFTVAADGIVVGTGISTGPDPVCFDDLEPGTYEVAQTVPPTLEMTTGASVEVQLAAGQTLDIKFGSRMRAEDETMSDEVASSDTVEADTGGSLDENVQSDGGDSSSSLLALSGLVALFVAIVLLGVLIFLLLRQRT